MATRRNNLSQSMVVDKQRDRDIRNFQQDIYTQLQRIQNQRLNEEQYMWINILDFLKRLKATINRYKMLPIPCKKELAKTLTQCLDASLHAVHIDVFSVYKIIFDREIELYPTNTEEDNEVELKSQSNIALFFSGLFSSYQSFNFEVKKEFLQPEEGICQKMLQMKKEIILSLSGFMLCLLPALDEQTEVLRINAKKILLKIEEIVGTSNFFGEIWKAILRVPKIRACALKYLKERIPKSHLIDQNMGGQSTMDDDDSDDYDDEDDEVTNQYQDNYRSQSTPNVSSQNQIWVSEYTILIKDSHVLVRRDKEKEKLEKKMQNEINSDDLNNYFYFYYPNKSKLVMNALKACLSQENIIDVKSSRAALDFMISHMPINSVLNHIEENIFLAEAAILCFAKNDFAINAKIVEWLFQHIDNDEGEPIKETDPSIISIVNAMKKIFDYPMHQWHMRFNPVYFLLRIVSSETGEPDATYPVMKNLTIEFLKFIQILSFSDKNDDKLQTILKGGLKHLLDEIEDFQACFDYLIQQLETQIKKQSKQNENYGDKTLDNNLLETINLIDFLISNLLKYEKNQNQLFTDNNQIYYQDIIRYLLSGMKNVMKNQYGETNLQIIMSSLKVIEKILNTDSSQQEPQNKKNKHQDIHPGMMKSFKLTEECIGIFNDLYAQMSRELVQNHDLKIQDDPSRTKYEIETFKRYNQLMYQIIPQQIFEDSQRPPWLENFIECCKSSYPAICLNSIEFFLKIVSNEDQFNSEGAQQIQNIQRLITFSNTHGHGNKSEKIDLFDKRTNNFKDYILEELQNDSNKVDGKSGYSICREIVENLWNILEKDVDTEEIVNKLKDFDCILPKIFSDVVMRDLQETEQRVKQDKAIQKFAKFWKFTSNLQLDNKQSYIPFQKALPDYYFCRKCRENKKNKEKEMRDNDLLNQIDQLQLKSMISAPLSPPLKNKEYHPQCKRKHLVLHNILEFLEDHDPTLRLSCRSWLQQNTFSYDRILDPIIEEFINFSNFKNIKIQRDELGYQKISNRAIEIDGEFQTEYIIQNFGKLRNIILNSQDEIINFIIAKNCSSHIQEQFNKKYKYQRLEESGDLSNYFQNEDPDRDRNTDSLSPSPLTVPSKTNAIQNAQTLSFGSVQFEQSPQGNKNRSQQVPPIPHMLNAQDNQMKKQVYLHILVYITLVFIQAKQSTGDETIQQIRAQKEDETLTVNASACEFLQLILKHVEKQEFYSNNLALMIIRPLIQHFYNVIKEKNKPMQDNIMNLLEYILNNCNVIKVAQEQKQRPGEAEQKQRWIEVFRDELLLKSLIMGLEDSDTFERQKFIKFIKMYVPYIKKFTCQNLSFYDDFKTQYFKLMDSLMGLLKRVDRQIVSIIDPDQEKKTEMLSQNVRKDYSMKNVDIGMKRRINGRSSSMANSDYTQEMVITPISQESDILAILSGLECIVQMCVKSESFAYGDGVNQEHIFSQITKNWSPDEIKNYNQISGKSKRHEILTDKNFFGGQRDPFKDLHQIFYIKMPNHASILQQIIVSCMYCWNNPQMFKETDSEHYFTRFGIFGFHEQYKDRYDRLKPRNADIYDILQTQELSLIPKKIIQILRLFAQTSSNAEEFMYATFDIWLRKELLGLRHLKVNRKDLNIKNCYQKLMQMIVCSYQAYQIREKNQLVFILPVDKVIDCIIRYIKRNSKFLENNGHTLITYQRWNKKSVLNPIHVAAESILNQFLYTFLVYSTYDPTKYVQYDSAQFNFRRVYIKMMEYLQLFKESRSPFTLLWQLELLKIFGTKYNLTEIQLAENDRKEFNKLITKLISNCSQMLTDSYEIRFDQDQQYSFVFPPTVYELLWRYEYIQYKQEPELTNHSRYDNDKDAFSDYSGNDDIPESVCTPIVENNMRIKEDLRKNSTLPEMINGSIFFGDEELREMSAKNFEFAYKEINQKQSDLQQQIMQSIFKDMPILMHKKENLSKTYANQSKFMENLRMGLRGFCKSDDILEHSKYYVIVTLKQVLGQLQMKFQKWLTLEDRHKHMKLILDSCIQIMRQKMKSAANIKKDNIKQVKQLTYLEQISDLFQQMILVTQQIDQEQFNVQYRLLRQYRTKINELFNNDSFFDIDSMYHLRQWQLILKQYSNDPGNLDDIFKNQIEQWRIQTGFNFNQKLNFQKCAIMQRIAFLIFSCDSEKFESKRGNYIEMEQQLSHSKFGDVIRKIIDSLKNEGINRAESYSAEQIDQRIFLFFLIRVILAKMQGSHQMDDFNKQYKKLWPHLLSELVSIFERQEIKIMQPLIIESIKLIELQASLNLEDFQMNQWIFLVDSIGMKQITNAEQLFDLSPRMAMNNRISQPIPQIEPNKFMDLSNTYFTNNESQLDEAEHFKTFIVKYIGQKQFIFNHIEESQKSKNGLNNKLGSYLQKDEQEDMHRNFDGDRDKYNNIRSRSESHSLVSPSKIDNQTQEKKTMCPPNLKLEITDEHLKPVELQSSSPIPLNNTSFNNDHNEPTDDVFQRASNISINLPETTVNIEACKLQQAISQNALEIQDYHRKNHSKKIEKDFLRNKYLLNQKTTQR